MNRRRIHASWIAGVLHSALAGALILASPVAAQEATPPPAAHVVRGSAFEVRCHWRSEASLDAHARALSEVLEAVARASQLAAPDDAKPLVVHAYDSPRALAKAKLPSESGRWLSERTVVGGMGIGGRGEIHVALQPRVLDRVHARLGTSPLLLRRAALHGAALLRRDWAPVDHENGGDPWVLRGLELAWAERGLRATNRARAASAEPAVSAGRASLARAFAEDAVPQDFFLRHELSDGAFGATLDAADAARLAVGEALLDGLGGLPPVRDWLAGAPGARLEVLESEQLARLDDLVRAAAADHLWREVTPASFTHPARLAADGTYADPGGLVQWTTRTDDALLVARETIGEARYRIAGTFEPHALEAGVAAQMDVAFGVKPDEADAPGERFLCVFNTREGTWVFRRDPASGEYQQVCGDPGLRPRGGEPNLFELRVEGDLVKVGLNGTPMRPGRAGGLDLTGAWGLGAHAGSAGIWRGVGWGKIDD